MSIVPEKISNLAKARSSTKRLCLPPKLMERGPLKDAGMISAGRAAFEAPYALERNGGAEAPHLALWFVMAGELEFEFEGAKPFKAGAGAFVVMPSVFSRRIVLKSRAFDHMYFHFAGGELAARAEKPAAFEAMAAGQLAETLLRLNAESSSAEPDAEACAFHYAKILALLLNRELDAALRDSWRQAPAKIRRLRDAIYAEPGRDWTLKEMAASAGVSQSSLHSLLKSHYGLPPLRLVRQARMSLAEDLLETTDDKLFSIASATGYADEYAFSKAFMKLCKIRPGEFRRRARSKARARR